LSRKEFVLLRVEHFQKRRRGVAAEVGPDLVNLVEHDERVIRPRLLQGGDDAPRHRADVRAPMAANLGLVVQAAQRETHELAVERTRD